MKRIILIVVLIIVAVLIVWGFLFYWKFLRGVRFAFQKPAEDIAELISDGSREPGETVNLTNFPLDLPPGFSIEIFAKDLPGARVMVFDRLGNMWVSRTREGAITLLQIGDNGRVESQSDIFNNLNRPHGLALDPNNGTMLYFAEEDKISRVPLYTDAGPEKIIDLPEGGNHFTRTLDFGPDDRLYVSIGSTCNVCFEKDERRAAIYTLNRDGSNFKQFAWGLRNAVFFTWSFVDARMWVTEMGRDLLGDNIPPDEINIVKEGGNYGWPECYGKNIFDTDFHTDDHEHIRAHCTEPFETGSFIDIQAHSSPLGLAFIPKEGWPEEYWYDLIVVYHGSWNRTEPTGYKLVRMKLDKFGNYTGTEDFISGWLTDGGDTLGRPVDVLVQPGGVMYVSDDRAGIIYKVTYE